MGDQVENSYLLQMPTLVIEKILSNVLNLTNVSCTCKYLYDAVCQMERKREACIIRFSELDHRLTIDDDALFDSIMNSHRTITNIQLNKCYVTLNERQLERLTAIMKRFRANIISLRLGGVRLPIDKIIELLNQTPKLESLEFDRGEAFGSATTTLQLSNLKKLSIKHNPGVLEIVDSLPSGSLNEFFGLRDHQQVVQTILSKQHNLKSLKIGGISDPVVLCVNNLQLEKLELGSYVYRNNDELMEILKCHSNLKELRLQIDDDEWWPRWRLQPNAFEWICENLMELEVLRVAVDSPGKNFYSMLGKLTKLRYFSTNIETLRDAKFQLRIDSLAKLEIYGYNRSNEDFSQMVQSMAPTFTNLTALDITVEDFSELDAVLSQCTKLIHLTINIDISNPHHHFAEKTFRNIRHLTITLKEDIIQVSVITGIVRAMPNLKSLLMTNNTIKFNVNAVKEFILASKSLEELEVSYFRLDQDLSPIDGFVETIRRLSDQLKAYRLTFMPYDVSALKDILSDDFNDRGSKTKIILCKGFLSDFHGYP